MWNATIGDPGLPGVRNGVTGDPPGVMKLGILLTGENDASDAGDDALLLVAGDAGFPESSLFPDELSPKEVFAMSSSNLLACESIKTRRFASSLRVSSFAVPSIPVGGLLVDEVGSLWCTDAGTEAAAMMFAPDAPTSVPRFADPRPPNPRAANPETPPALLKRDAGKDPGSFITEDCKPCLRFTFCGPQGSRPSCEKSGPAPILRICFKRRASRSRFSTSLSKSAIAAVNRNTSVSIKVRMRSSAGGSGRAFAAAIALGPHCCSVRDNATLVFPPFALADRSAKRDALASRSVSAAAASCFWAKESVSTGYRVYWTMYGQQSP